MKRSQRTVLRTGHQVLLLQGGRELFPAMREAIAQARREVMLETYIFWPDAEGEQMAQTLLAAARRGVAVYLVADGVGTPSLPAQWLQSFAAAGVRSRIYQPASWPGLLRPSRWQRLHRKLCVVDGELAFCGGINVLDDSYDPNYGRLGAPRLDFAVRVSGPLVRSAHEVMQRFWRRLSSNEKARGPDWPAAWRALQQSLRRLRRPAQPAQAPATGVRAALLLRDNVRHRQRIELAYRRAFMQAQAEILVANAYFLPGRRLRQTLIAAAQRGVRVCLLLQGRYEYFMQYHAARPVYGSLLQAGVEIYEYAPSFLHAKVAVIDNYWATVGSSNLDPLSLLLAREANVVIEDADFAAELRARLLHAMEHEGRRLDPQDYAQRPWRVRLLDWLAFALLRTALFLTGRRY